MTKEKTMICEICGEEIKGGKCGMPCPNCRNPLPCDALTVPSERKRLR